jgi:hypothetical protein
MVSKCFYGAKRALTERVDFVAMGFDNTASELRFLNAAVNICAKIKQVSMLADNLLCCGQVVQTGLFYF